MQGGAGGGGAGVGATTLSHLIQHHHKTDHEATVKTSTRVRCRRLLQVGQQPRNPATAIYSVVVVKSNSHCVLLIKLHFSSPLYLLAES